MIEERELNFEGKTTTMWNQMTKCIRNVAKDVLFSFLSVTAKFIDRRGKYKERKKRNGYKRYVP